MIIGYVLLALGVAVFVLSFVIPAKTEEEKATEFSEELIKDMVGKEVEEAKSHLNDIVDETVTYAMEKTERSIDRLTNEKIMAVNEYSDTVLSEINKNHQEVVFLYDMLNDKHENLKDTVSEMDKKTSEVKQAVLDAELTVKETREKVEEAKEQLEEAKVSVKEAQTAAQEAAFSAQQMQRTPAIERLKSVQATENVYDDSFNPIIVPRIEIEEAPKVEKRKRTTKPKVREEAVVVTDPLDVGEVLDGSLELIQNEEVQKAPRREGPNINLGMDGTGQNLGSRNNKERILELHKAGKSSVAIAKELGLGIGEVKLVVDLYKGM